MLHGDGGGRVPAIARPLHGRGQVVKALAGWARVGARGGGFELRPVDVNGQPGALPWTPTGDIIGVLTLEITDGRIQAISSVVNPDKLRHLGPIGDVRAYVRSRPRRD